MSFFVGKLVKSSILYFAFNFQIYTYIPLYIANTTIASEVILHGVLAKHFGLATLHQWQLRTIHGTLEGRDGLVVLPTESGKSICFYLPSLITKNITLVVTPTISLMTDQVASLKAKGISATFLGMAQADKSVMAKVVKCYFSIVCTTPESLVDSSTDQPYAHFNKLAKDGKICMVAIDEAHLIQSWKYFR